MQSQNELPLISVIIPVYNVEKYLTRCLESVITQTYSNLEIILVDDGSTDGSGKVCDRYQEKDSRIKVVHKKNGGVSDARNEGIKVAAGKYITFVDSDDYVSDDYVSCLFAMISEERADIAVGTYVVVNDREQNQFLTAPKQRYNKTFSGIEAINNSWYKKEITNSTWAKLYKKELFLQVEYQKGKVYEDLGTTYKLLYKAKKVVYADYRIYYYVQREGSIMHSSSKKRIEDRFEISDEIIDWATKNCRECLPASKSINLYSAVQGLADIDKENYSISLWNKSINRIVEFRKDVLKDIQAPKKMRLLALLCFINPRILKELLGIYRKVKNVGKAYYWRKNGYRKNDKIWVM